jgi:hypothetical protein
VGDYPFAARLGGGEVFSTMCHLPAGANVGYSAMLMHCAQTMFVTVSCRWQIPSFKNQSVT